MHSRMLANLPAGHVLCDRYRIRRILGKGGMGVVYEAEDTALRRQVALKLTTVRNPLADDESDQRREERFLREASINAQIAHPNVVTIYDYGRGEVGVESFCYIAMELLGGETLGHRMRRTRGPLPVTELLPIFTQIARGLRAAHSRGLVHRDLKPDNIMLTPGEDGVDVARILDFGLAKDTKDDAEQALTDAGTVMGTPEYMAPEQVLAHEVDARTDLYAFGCLLFECVSGAPPYRNSNPIRVASSHVCEPTPPLKTPPGSPKPSTQLAELVQKLMEKKPEDRVQSAEDALRLMRELPEAQALRVCEPGDSLSLTTACRYQTGRKLAESAGAVIYEATHLELGRQVAVKIFRAVQSLEVARLKRELPSLAMLRHHANARVLDVGMTSQAADGRPFLVMERVRGPTLRQVLNKKRKMPWRRAVDLAIEILQGLGEAHAVGVLHRHLSPEHVLVPNAGTRREGVKIIGYRVAEGGADFTGPMLLALPDPAYTAPEVLRGSALSERTDLYAVGVMLHEAVHGRLPGTLPAQARPSQPVSQASPDEPPAELIDLIRRAVSVDPAERCESADEFETSLAAIRDADPAPVSGTQDSRPRISLGQQRLRSTGRPVVWVLTGDPALRKPPMTEVIMGLRDSMSIEEIGADQRTLLATKLRDEEELPPWLVLFGGMHVVLEDPVLSTLARAPEVARLLVSTHANADLLDAAINFCGIDQHVVLPSSVARLKETIERLVVRTGASRRLYDDLRLAAQRGTPPPAQTRAERMVITIH
ncbi:MAG: serine/threonine-protein kinase [Polyangiaceae bacterium]